MTQRIIYPDRTLEKALSVGCKQHYITLERMLSSVRSHLNNNSHQYDISDLIQLIKGNLAQQFNKFSLGVVNII